ncbi:MAG: DUF4349 domain-containing protein [Armatimonadota bacterium]
MSRLRWFLITHILLWTLAGMATPANTETAVALRSANIVMKVPSFTQARDKVLQLVLERQGVLLDARTQVKPDGSQFGTLTVQVPRWQMDALLQDVRGVGKLYGDNVQTRDRTAEYELLGRREALLRQNEVELLKYLHSPRHLRGSDILYVQYRLFQTRLSIAQTAQGQQDLQRGAGRSAVKITLFESGVHGAARWHGWWGRQMGKLGNALFAGLRNFANLLLFLASSWPIFLVLILLAWIGWAVWRRARRGILPTR